MIIADTGALLSLSTVEILDTVLEQFQVHTTREVIQELEQTEQGDDELATAASVVIEKREKLEIHRVKSRRFQSSRVDAGEASCAALTREIEAEFLLTDDLHAIGELRRTSSARVVITPVVLKALVKRGELDRQRAGELVDMLAEKRGWLGTPIYSRAKSQLDLE